MIASRDYQGRSRQNLFYVLSCPLPLPLHALKIEERAWDNSRSNGSLIDESEVAIPLVYLDDIVLFWCTPNEQINHVRQVLTL